MKILLLSLLLTATKLYALDAAAIRKIASEPHSRDHLIPELRIFPDAREYEITTQNGHPEWPRDLHQPWPGH